MQLLAWPDLTQLVEGGRIMFFWNLHINAFDEEAFEG